LSSPLLFISVDDGTDEELIASVPTSAAAFELFYRRHVSGVTRYLAGRCPTPEDVADATAATFLAVLRSASTFDASQGSATGWLFSIAAHEAHRQGRAHRRDEGLRARLSGQRLLSPDDIERVGEMIDAARNAERIARLMESAPSSERSLLGALVIDGNTVAGASRALGISPEAGRVRLSRLRRRLTFHREDAFSNGDKPKTTERGIREC
jgi:RNA polymerase sigma-70 factor (ECF subfamily)